jgi:DNA-binding phage protein
MTQNQITEPFLIRLKAAIDADDSITPASLATKAGLSNATIRHMFARNHNPRVATMRKICAALGTTLEEFMSNAQTEEEYEIVRLVTQLPAPLRQKLLGYGQALLESADQAPPESDSDN